MQQMDDLVRVILISGEGEDEFRVHVGMSREAYQRAKELISQEKEKISNDRRTELFYQAMKEFPPRKK
jgi:hypothetical protein